MPHIERTASVVWEGNIARGAGSISAATSGAFSELEFSLPTRIGQAEGKTSPEELLAAAHGGGSEHQREPDARDLRAPVSRRWSRARWA